MDENTVVRVANIKGGEIQRITLAAASELCELRVDEIMWALEEHGYCETEDYVITEIGEQVK